MPTTSNHAFPYPALTDPPDGPGQIGALASAVDAALVQQRADIMAALSTMGDYVDLQDGDRQITGNAWEDWGVLRATIPNPGKAVTVFAIASGHAFNDASGGNYYASVRVAVSLDGGSSWAYGNGPRQQSAPDGTWAAGTSIHLASGIPSSSIVIKAQHQSSSTSSEFYNGRVLGVALHLNGGAGE